MTPYYADDLVTLYHGDARELLPCVIHEPVGCLVIDPPWDDTDLLTWRFGGVLPFLPEGPTLVFTDARRFGGAVNAFGAPTWVFTWDTMSPWQTGPRRPLQQTKHCLWFGDLNSYARDRVLWGDPPPRRDHPSTKQVPLDGRRLTDLYRQSLRWLHHPGAGDGSAGTERFSHRRGHPVLRHAKPLPWIKCLIGNCSEGIVVDPFAGSGTSLYAARELGRRAIGIEIDEAACEYIAESLQVAA